MNPYLQIVKQMITDEHLCMDDLKDIISKEDTPKNLTDKEMELERIIERIMNRKPSKI